MHAIKFVFYFLFLCLQNKLIINETHKARKKKKKKYKVELADLSEVYL